MRKVSEERLRQLDEFSLLWLLRQLSLGNLLRCIQRLSEAVEPRARRLRDCASEHTSQCRKRLSALKTAYKKARKEADDSPEPIL
jgi:hypothetical protein